MSSPHEQHVTMVTAPLVIYGFPLVEALRTCRNQTQVGAVTRFGRAPFNQLSASDHPWTHHDRDIVTPANDLLYFIGWANLENGPVTLEYPEATGRYFVVELLDPYTENFKNLGPRNLSAGKGRITLLPPGAPDAASEGAVACPYSLVWIFGRVLVRGDEDLPQALAYQDQFRIVGSPAAQAPRSISAWSETGDEGLDFFQNLFNGLADYPPREAERGIFGLALRFGLVPGERVDVFALKPAVREGLRTAWRQAHALIRAHTTSQSRKPWSFNTRLGAYRGDFFIRACTAMKGLGAVTADEAIYAQSDFDADGNPYDGSLHRYRLRFPPGALPPAQAFWSVSLYGQDLAFIDHPVHRYALGDRSPGLHREADGSLVLAIQHEAPETQTENWLPAPQGRFYLILRIYWPTPDMLAGRYAIPPVEMVKP